MTLETVSNKARNSQTDTYPAEMTILDIQVLPIDTYIRQQRTDL